MLSSGIPKRTEYLQLGSHHEYQDLLSYSREFEAQIRDRGLPTRLYGLKWVRDPFLQWSRSWEYVFVLQRLGEWYRAHSDKAEVADAGSGFTFFPFYLQETRSLSKIQCLDADVTVAQAIAEASSSFEVAPAFQLENLERLSHDADSFDVIYSISVIEHTRNPVEVVNEVYRTLKPGGLFICTFDVSFEQRSSMHVRHVKTLVDHIFEIFIPESGWEDLAVADAACGPDAVTTEWISEIAPERLPWKYPSLLWLYDALRGRFRWSLYRPMTFYCGAFYKP